MKKSLTLKRKLLYGFLALVLVTTIYSYASNDNSSDLNEDPTSITESLPEAEAITEDLSVVNADPEEVITPEPEAVAAPVTAVVVPTTTYVEDTPVTSQVETTVYVTKTGEKYHSAGCQYLRQSEIPISLSDVRTSYSPCSKCNPPR